MNPRVLVLALHMPNTDVERQLATLKALDGQVVKKVQNFRDGATTSFVIELDGVEKQVCYDSNENLLYEGAPGDKSKPVRATVLWYGPRF